MHVHVPCVHRPTWERVWSWSVPTCIWHTMVLVLAGEFALYSGTCLERPPCCS